ncbi:MAG: LytTR family transcriptional regulator [Erythrobacter sp.]|nr:LytTR family transcriptional regulator [Erythrobacter sp.]
MLRDPRHITALAFAGFGLLYMVVNAASMIDQRRALGQPIPVWQAWVLEGTSFVAWLVMVPVIVMIAARLAPRPPWIAALGHAIGCGVLSLAHTAIMAGLRITAFGLAGLDYGPGGSWLGQAVFEARKDVITYVSILAIYLLARRLIAVSAARLPEVVGATPLIELRDGSRLVMLRPDEIDWVSAAGNYVELHGSFGSELARRTMADIEATLAPHGFVRVHRSRLVRRAAIAAIETRQSGDFDMMMRSGVAISGSRRFRHNLHEGSQP